MKPLAIDLFCGLGGWTEGLLAEGFRVIGFDIEKHEYGDAKYPAQLVLQDVLTIHGSQFKDAALIVASPPCQEFSYMAMPWSKAKAKQADILANPTEWLRLCALFDACFRIQQEAIEAAGHFIPLVVENVRGAQRWVGRSRWNYGSFHLWGDVPALMPMTKTATKLGAGASWYPPDDPRHTPGLDFTRLAGQKVPGFRFDGKGGSFQTAAVESTGVKSPGMNWSDQSKRGQDFTRPAAQHCGMKNDGGSWFNIPGTGGVVGNRNPVHDHIKQGGDLYGPGEDCSAQRRAGSKSKARKAASAAIAKIPFPLARHIAHYWKPTCST